VNYDHLIPWVKELIAERKRLKKLQAKWREEQMAAIAQDAIERSPVINGVRVITIRFGEPE